jgi:hypothetical protein
MRALSPLARISLVTLLVGACASSPGSGGSGGSGGSSSTGGVNGTGGSVSSTGGTPGTGGSVSSTGGTPGTGGSVSTGGTPGTGGMDGTGGSGGHGGQTGTGGSGGHGGQTGTGGSSATGGAGGGSAAVIFSDDFESDTSGKQPAGWDNLLDYNYKMTSNPDQQGSSALADATQTHNSSKLAAHFVVSGSNMAFLEHALPSGTNHLFVRVYVYLKNSIGDMPMSTNNNHETLLGLTMTPNNADNQLRFGEAKGAIGLNQVPSDDYSPVMAKEYGGPKITAATWHCIEVEFNGTTSYNSYNAWSDGTLVDSIASSADWAHGTTTPNWMNGYFNSFMIGWQSFSSLANEVWFDDLVLSTARVGCN